MSDRPVVRGASIEAFPEEGLGEGNREKPSSWLQAATNLGEEQRRRELKPLSLYYRQDTYHYNFYHQQSYPPHEKSDVMFHYLRATGSFICLITA